FSGHISNAENPRNFRIHSSWAINFDEKGELIPLPYNAILKSPIPRSDRLTNRTRSAYDQLFLTSQTGHFMDDIPNDFEVSSPRTNNRLRVLHGLVLKGCRLFYQSYLLITLDHFDLIHEVCSIDKSCFRQVTLQVFIEGRWYHSLSNYANCSPFSGLQYIYRQFCIVGIAIHQGSKIRRGESLFYAPHCP